MRKGGGQEPKKGRDCLPPVSSCAARDAKGIECSDDQGHHGIKLRAEVAPTSGPHASLAPGTVGSRVQAPHNALRQNLPGFAREERAEKLSEHET